MGPLVPMMGCASEVPPARWSNSRAKVDEGGEGGLATGSGDSGCTAEGGWGSWQESQGSHECFHYPGCSLSLQHSLWPLEQKI